MEQFMGLGSVGSLFVDFEMHLASAQSVALFSLTYSQLWDLSALSTGVSWRNLCLGLSLRLAVVRITCL